MSTSIGPRLFGGLALALGALAGAASAQTFIDVTDSAGLGGDYLWGPKPIGMTKMMSAIAVEDYDGDGWDDIFWTGGGAQRSKLFKNDGLGGFVDVAATAGVDVQSSLSMPLWFDKDDDGDLDLFLMNYEMVYPLEFGVAGSGVNQYIYYPAGLEGDAGTPFASTSLAQHHNFMFENQGDGTFIDVADEAGLRRSGLNGAAVGDVDGDGRVDLVGGSLNTLPGAYLFKNAGNGRFRNVTPQNLLDIFSFPFAPGFIDYDNDNDLDLYWTGDFETSTLLRNDGNLTFVDVTDDIGLGTDENGMGTSWGDPNRDGRADWFISSIWNDEPFDGPFANAWGITGNRLYMNDGAGAFSDETDSSGTRIGHWGWGARMGDLDNDGWEDIVHTNGWYTAQFGEPQYEDDPMVAFINQGNAVFTEQAAALGLDEVHQGRGLAMFDYDKDGDLDILVANNDTGLSLYRNDYATGNYIKIDVRNPGSNRWAIGAKVTVRITGEPNMTRWVHANDNFMSQSPIDAYFGVGNATEVQVLVRWPQGGLTNLPGVPVNQDLVIVNGR